MQPYYIFIDTEANGMPDGDGGWTIDGQPLAMVQVSWLVHNAKRELVEKRDFYIGNADFEISEDAIKLHGIDKDKLRQLGVDRKMALRLLQEDLEQYKGMIVGHYIRFDMQLLALEFERVGMYNPCANLATCCTMQASALLVDYPFRKFYKLDELYALLFGETNRNWHNAAEDAEATARCFYRLYDQGLIGKAFLTNNKMNRWFHLLLWVVVVGFVLFILYVITF
ncbi:3'-5' exonuclease [Olivibacter sitiensis]|uniref:3'-5' exonuclease n=1 Tax=Olivibacter sitiensis TaxID=376470 RepID=UPI00042089B0|nr:3'-5' exonuclease [Olivibacter sitiensis]